MYEEYLMHHGVKGMKWGIRKDPEKTGRQRKKKISQMSDQELKRLVERKELEKRYKQATSKPKKQKTAFKNTLIGGLIVASLSPVIIKHGKVLADKLFTAGQKAATDYIFKASGAEKAANISADLINAGSNWLFKKFY